MLPDAPIPVEEYGMQLAVCELTAPLFRNPTIPERLVLPVVFKM
jgi:hypothetical protein